MANNYNIDQRKWILKQYCKLENAEHVLTTWKEDFDISPPSRKVIYCIRNKFETLEIDGNQNLCRSVCQSVLTYVKIVAKLKVDTLIT